ncbi:uncharacterized protein LOC130962843 [Arachis stenosperma]|uniref:uncharacterized protein LOC130962843 n=1 Tax=Arachis stenosperma TaxID=217475 RepID=UPI0025AD1EBE|nr:uncharacterized protein LOC130962843 [Arachis stenosperma]
MLGDCDTGNQVQKDIETAQNHENENSGQAEPETATTKNSRDNSVLSHESEGNPKACSIQNPLVPESASKSTRPREWRFLKNYPEEFVIGNVSRGVRTRSSTRKANEKTNIVLLSQIEPQNVKEALSDPSWVKAMEDELLEFEKNQVWTLVPRPSGKKVIGTKWIFRNKLGEDETTHMRKKIIPQRPPREKILKLPSKPNPSTRSRDQTFTPSPSPPTSPPRTDPMARTKTTPRYPTSAKPTPPPKATPSKLSSSKLGSSKGKCPATKEPIPESTQPKPKSVPVRSQ